MHNFYLIHPKHVQETASTERAWNSIALSINHNIQSKENSPGDRSPFLQWSCWVDVFSLSNSCLR